jgi:excisionase family DNA binding protein
MTGHPPVNFCQRVSVGREALANNSNSILLLRAIPVPLLGHVLEPVPGEFGLGPNAAKQQFMNDHESQFAASEPMIPWRLKQEIADYYRCDLRTITNLMRRRILPFVKIGRIVRFNIEECDRAMNKYKRPSMLLQRDSGAAPGKVA